MEYLWEKRAEVPFLSSDDSVMNRFSIGKVQANFFACLALGVLLPGSFLQAQETVVQEKRVEASKLTPNSSQVSVAESTDTAAAGIVATFQAGAEGYPGFYVAPQDGEVWDFSAYGHIQASIVNTGQEPFTISLRVDNKGPWQEKPWNTESVRLKPGETGSLKVIFGYAYGQKPGYKLNPAAISSLLFFTGKVSRESSFRIESIKAAGPAGETPPVDLSKVRLKPKDGYIVGGSAVLDPAKQIVFKEGTEASSPDGQILRLSFNQKGQSVTVKPPHGMWDLRDGYQVRMKIKNVGALPSKPSLRVDSKAGSTDLGTPDQTLAPGMSVEMVSSFIPAVSANIDNEAKPKPLPAPGTGTKFTSDGATGVTILADESGGKQAYEVEFIRLEAPPVELPDWVGKRPPVEGEWVQTFREEFNGDGIDLSKWNIYASNFWDKRTHFSKNNVIVANGVAKLRCEKKTGRHNDDPNGKETAYATGFLNTYGKWVQRYGYFEARMKLPKAPGLWPAFWLMPDRGLAAGEQWKRADTGNGGMEFDIMEFLSRWGGYRFTTVFHWDGYAKDHKATAAGVYTAQDKDGYITTGLLWMPGEAVIYNNGNEVARWKSPRISDVPSEIIFTNVTGGWDNSPLEDAHLPDDFAIDYVRCWQRKDWASDLDGVKSTQATPAAPTVADPAKP